jgi:tetratricopeptide (TPR) repeat protein
MRASNRGRSVIGVAGPLLRTGVLVLSAWAALVGLTAAAEPPVVNKPAALSDAERTKLYGEEDWHAADALWALRDEEIRSRLTVEQRRELITANQANSQAVALYRKGDFREAIRFAEQAASIQRRLLGAQHPDTATSFSNLAELYQALGDYAKAEPLLRQALKIRKKALGKITRTRPGASTTSLGCTACWGITRRRSRSIGRRWRSTRKSWAKITRTRSRALTTWLCCTCRWGIMRKRSHSIGRRWRSVRKSWGKIRGSAPKDRGAH